MQAPVTTPIKANANPPAPTNAVGTAATAIVAKELQNAAPISVHKEAAQVKAPLILIFSPFSLVHLKNMVIFSF